MVVAGAAGATTIRVENHSAATLSLSAHDATGGLQRQLRGTLLPHASTFVRRPGGKVLALRREADKHLFDIVVTSEDGRGCRFRTVAEQHSEEWVLIIPVAHPIGTGRCEARTGRTIGDFVFIAS
ncbi:hypothetical protein ATB93_15215 [Sphingomonas sp. WG]|nr:hypothetical protein ATB93_15215 [Sphingomonas sp. WG]